MISKRVILLLGLLLSLAAPARGQQGPPADVHARIAAGTASRG